MEPESGDKNLSTKEQIRERVLGGLNFGERYANLPQGNRERIANILVEHTDRICDLLGINPLEVNFGYSTPEMVSQQFVERPALNVVITQDGQLSYAVLFPQKEMDLHLKLISNRLVTPYLEDLTISSLAHELFHLKQFKTNLESAFKSAEAAQKGGVFYLQDEGESAARLFALSYIAKRDIPLHDLLRQNARLITVLGGLTLESYVKLYPWLSRKLRKK